MRLGNNINSLNIYKNYKRNIGLNSKVLERISSGKKLNGSKDNPVKVGQSQEMRLQIRGLQIAERNLQDTVSFLQTADSAMSSIDESLNRMKELLVKANTGTISNEDKEIIKIEIESLKDEIEITAKETKFNGIPVIGIEFVGSNDVPYVKNLLAGANKEDGVELPMFNLSPDVLRNEKGTSLRNMKIDTPADMEEAFSVVEASKSIVSSCRSKYGALHGRFESTMNNVIEKGLANTAAESRIADSDMALEIAELSRTNLLKDSSLAILRQSNQFPKDVLEILRNMR